MRQTCTPISFHFIRSVSDLVVVALQIANSSPLLIHLTKCSLSVCVYVWVSSEHILFGEVFHRTWLHRRCTQTKIQLRNVWIHSKQFIASLRCHISLNNELTLVEKGFPNSTLCTSASICYGINSVTNIHVYMSTSHSNAEHKEKLKKNLPKTISELKTWRKNGQTRFYSLKKCILEMEFHLRRWFVRKVLFMCAVLHEWRKIKLK